MESNLYNGFADSTFQQQEVEMSYSEKTTGEIKSNIGVGASIGAIGGAVLAAWLFQTSLAVIIASAMCAALGAAIGSRSRSQVGQYMWFTYSKAVAIRFIVSTILFLILFLAAIYFAVQDADKRLKLVLAFAASLSIFSLVISIPFQGFIALIIVMFSWLVGRFIVAWRYR
jgi:hypothetical protein